MHCQGIHEECPLKTGRMQGRLRKPIETQRAVGEAVGESRWGQACFFVRKSRWGQRAVGGEPLGKPLGTGLLLREQWHAISIQTEGLSGIPLMKPQQVELVFAARLFNTSG